MFDEKKDNLNPAAPEDAASEAPIAEEAAQAGAENGRSSGTENDAPKGKKAKKDKKKKFSVWVHSTRFKHGSLSSVFVVGVLVLAVLLALILAGCVANKTDKKTVMTGSMLLTIIACLIIGFLPSKSVWLYTYVAIYALGNSGFWTMIYAMSYDSAILEQIETGKKPDGLYTSLIGLFMKFGNALGTLIMGFGLQLIGFSSESETQTEASSVCSVSRLPS